MGKTAKPKARQISTHSRAARRAASPSLDAPTAAKPSNLSRTRSTSPDHKTTKPHILAASTGAGISKAKSPKAKPMKRGQRLRALEAAEKAEANAEKLALKVAKSLGREKKVKERRKGWEDINEAKRKKAAKANAFGALGGDDDDEVKGGGEWETLGDEVMDGADAEGVNEDSVVEGKVDVDVAAGLACTSREDPKLQAMPLPDDDVDPDL
ncbi:uncharacterized protein CC84DRAFT_1261440 [Paraphaeosphaeria sporulosa]|uniref:Alb1-domain-containing protein n=1 Tax=Paraphaeosphaeria sporulosa TaxID=1460663 RepID=A0A177C7L0_9PLEO|nr:uncharacterized protein CC84DRAFT_1261440 [Paraphaeosphaeria sporulosa]OAG02737.1 hypothetical protein CC84DRAFT_1261440 [Paraphaeosphaeria sporulosa]